jgi:hypothetical protein
MHCTTHALRSPERTKEWPCKAAVDNRHVEKATWDLYQDAYTEGYNYGDRAGHFPLAVFPPAKKMVCQF